jgi:hypothetical protein
MGRLHRAINLAIALVLVALGGVGLVYFYFITGTSNGWMALAAAIVGAAGLYWLWDEHINARADRRVETMPRDPAGASLLTRDERPAGSRPTW